MSDVRVFTTDSVYGSARITPEHEARVAAMQRVHQASLKRPVQVKACQCEHKDHFDGAEHPYLGVPANEPWRAEYVGPICTVCAVGHLHEYLIDPASITKMLNESISFSYVALTPDCDCQTCENKREA